MNFVILNVWHYSHREKLKENNKYRARRRRRKQGKKKDVLRARNVLRAAAALVFSAWLQTAGVF
jgi:hypothetical protein